MSQGKHQEFEKFANMKWRFIPPYSPWMGGMWEATVKSVKRYLLPMIATAYKTPLEIQSAMIQCSAILNARPLCSYESENGEAVLTPADLWKGFSNESLHPITLTGEQRFQDVDRFHQRQMKDIFLARYFAEDYLLALRDRTSKAYGNREFPEGRLDVTRVNQSNVNK